VVIGKVSPIGVPVITLNIAGKSWDAMIDTGFDGDLELPTELLGPLEARRSGSIRSILAGGQRIVEDRYELDFAFDGETVLAEATFVPETSILIGTHLLRRHRLEVNFVTRNVLLERVG